MQSVKELEWLAYYFKQHAREDLSAEILAQLCALRNFVQQSGKVKDSRDVIDFQQGFRESLDKAG